MESQLGDRIRELRLAHPVYKSLRQFATALRKSPSWVSKVERNLEKPGQDTLLEIARLLNANTNELYQLAERLEPDLEEAIVLRYSEMSGLLRTIAALTPEQIIELENSARKMKNRGDSLRLAQPLDFLASHLEVHWMDDAAIEAAANLLRYQFQKETGATCPPVCPETIIFDFLDERDRLSLDIETALGVDELEHPIAGKMTVADSVDEGGLIHVDRAVANTPLYPFTLAHEIGHWVLHRKAVIRMREQGSLFDERPCGTMTLQRNLQGSRGRLPAEEWQANRFAAHLLMPADLVKAEFNARFGSIVNYENLCESNSLFKTRFPDRREYSRHLATKICGEGGTDLLGLSALFKVSREAMAIRLEELALITDEASNDRRLI